MRSKDLGNQNLFQKQQITYVCISSGSTKACINRSSTVKKKHSSAIFFMQTRPTAKVYLIHIPKHADGMK